jgi:hypothetical protein
MCRLFVFSGQEAKAMIQNKVSKSTLPYHHVLTRQYQISNIIKVIIGGYWTFTQAKKVTKKECFMFWQNWQTKETDEEEFEPRQSGHRILGFKCSPLIQVSAKVLAKELRDLVQLGSKSGLDPRLIWRLFSESYKEAQIICAGRPPRRVRKAVHIVISKRPYYFIIENVAESG